MAEYQALYRKWRPLIFGDVVGQDHVSETLKNEIKTNRIAHAYLFCGTRGTGKTSTAKIFARAVNCTDLRDGDPCNECETCKGILNGSIMDVYEMDAASNNGVDNIREIRDEVAYTPSYGKYKVYIIDEVHMLSSGAFNALLKTLEEPPQHVIFILATTEPHKIPATILSRCQRFDFRRIRIMDVARRLSHISESEGINITPDAVELIADIADGSMRDGLSVLDQCIAHGREQLKTTDIAEIVGVVDKSSLFDIAECIAQGDTRGALGIIDNLMDLGKEVLSLFEDLITHYRNILICTAADDNGELIDKTQEVAEKYKKQGGQYSPSRITHCITVFSEYVLSAKWMAQPRVALEMAAVKACIGPDISQDAGGNNEVYSALLARIEALEKRVQTGGTIQQPVSRANRTEQVAPPPPVNMAQPVPTEEPRKEQTVSVSSGEWAGWKTALSTIQQESKQLFAFLYPAKVYGDNGNILIELTNSVAYDRVSTPKGIEYLEDLFSKIDDSECKVQVELKGNAPKNNNLTGLDEVAKMKDKLGDIMVIE